MTISPEIPRLVRFYSATSVEPKPVGTARLLDDRTLETTGLATSVACSGRSRALGPEGFMAQYSGWSNGYVFSVAETD